MQCYHVTDLGSDGPVKVPREGDICSRCAELGPKPEDVPDKYRELFRAARVLFKEGETDEYKVIPTLAFAANSSEMPELRSVREQFAEVKDKYAEETAAQKSEEWMKLYDQLFYHKYTALQPLDVKEGVMIVRSSPMRAINVEDEESGLIDMVQIDVHRLSEPAVEVASFYERNLRRIGIYYQEGRGDIGPRKLAPEREMIRIEARPEPGLRDPVGELGSGKWHQGPFPGPQLMGGIAPLARTLFPYAAVLSLILPSSKSTGLL